MTDNGKAQEVVKHIQAALTEMWEAEKLLNEMGVATCDNLYMRGSGTGNHVQIYEGIDTLAAALGKETYDEPNSDKSAYRRRIDYKGVRFMQLSETSVDKDGKVVYTWR